MMMNYYTINNIEKHFENKEAELATLLIFNAITSIFFGWLASEFMIMQTTFVFSIMYVWSKLEPD
jgi:hypothetical protein